MKGIGTTFLIAIAFWAAVISLSSQSEPRSDLAPAPTVTTSRAEDLRRGVSPTQAPKSLADARQPERELVPDLDVVALRAVLDAAGAPEPSACDAVRESKRAETDKELARAIETICVAWRKVMWDYAETYASEVEAGDPVAVERARTAFAVMNMALMRELMRVGEVDDRQDRPNTTSSL